MIRWIEERDEAFEAFNRSHPKGTLFQSFAWGKVKKDWEWRGIIVSRGEKITGVMAVLVRKIPCARYTFFYSPRGPVCDPEDEWTLSELTRGVRILAARERAILLKLDPDIPAVHPTFAETMTGLGYRLLPGAVRFEHAQAQTVVRLSLKDRDEAALLSGMHPKTRYNVRLAERKGVRVRTYGIEAIDDFYPLLCATGRRDRFCVRPKSYFIRLMDALGDRAAIFIADFNGTPIASAIAAYESGKAWYLYGASADIERKRMPNYLMQWEMIRWAKAHGCELYDFRGVAAMDDPADPLHGLWRFKRGFGGEAVRFVGEMELIFRPLPAKLFSFALPKVRFLFSRFGRIKKRIFKK